MATPEFVYQDPFPLTKDDTPYRLLSKEHVSLTKFDGKDILKIEPEALTLLANEAIRDVSFLLRAPHLKKVAAILKDPEASDNDRYVALAMLRNADTSSKGILPFCQDTGTATVFGKKGQQVWTGVKDEEYLAKGIYKTYTEEHLRYSQTAPLNMYDEVDTGTNLPAQIDLMATEGMEYQFLFVTKGGGSANKTSLYQETKALLNPTSLEKFLTEKMKILDRRAHGFLCGPVSIARRFDDYPGEGQSQRASDRSLQEVRRLLSGINRWPRGDIGKGKHQKGRTARVSGTWHGSDLEN